MIYTSKNDKYSHFILYFGGVSIVEICGLCKKETIIIGSKNKKNIHDLETILNNYDTFVYEVIQNGDECFEKIISSKPYLVLLDLCMNGKDGLWVLEMLSKKGYTHSGIIFISPLSCKSIPKAAVELGAKKCVKSPLDMDVMINIINKMIKRGAFMYHNNIETEKNISYRIAEVLNYLGILPGVKGYYYLKTAVTEVYKDFEKADGVTKKLYPYIANVYGTDAGKVERAIRHAIDVSWLKSPEGYNNVFGFKFMKKPTNRQIISQIAEYLKNKD
jgi:two-component system response regulator (stage 0 sporulation protein A)